MLNRWSSPILGTLGLELFILWCVEPHCYLFCFGAFLCWHEIETTLEDPACAFLLSQFSAFWLSWHSNVNYVIGLAWLDSLKFKEFKIVNFLLAQLVNFGFITWLHLAFWHFGSRETYLLVWVSSPSSLHSISAFFIDPMITLEALFGCVWASWYLILMV